MDVVASPGAASVNAAGANFFTSAVRGGNVTDVDSRRALVAWDRATDASSITAYDYDSGERARWDERRDDVEC